LWRHRTPRILFVAGLRRPPCATLFPYTTLFRSLIVVQDRLPQIQRCMETLLEHTGYTNYEVLLLNHGNQSSEMREWLAGVEAMRSEEHTSELQSRENLVCRLLLEKNKKHTAI